MLRRTRRKNPTRAELIERKHELEGQIRTLAAELRRLEARNETTARVESELGRLRNRHYQTRQQIDRAAP